MNQFLYSAGVQDGCDCISSAVSLGDFVYTSAQMGQGDSIEEQTITSMNKIIDALSNLGCELRHVIKFSVYVTDIQYKEEFLKTYKTYVEQPFPAVTF